MRRFVLLLAAALFLLPAAASAAEGYPAQNKAAVEAKLKAKGKRPWIEREKGMGVVTLKGSGTLTEDFFPLDAWEAASSLDLRDTMPRFAEGCDAQKGKADETSRALETALKKLPDTFKGFAGAGRVDKVVMKADGKTAYVFVIPMNKDFIAFTSDKKHFYYEVPAVLSTLESFVQSRADLDKVIWPARGNGYFMFVLQRKK